MVLADDNFSSIVSAGGGTCLSSITSLLTLLPVLLTTKPFACLHLSSHLYHLTVR